MIVIASLRAYINAFEVKTWDVEVEYGHRSVRLGCQAMVIARQLTDHKKTDLPPGAGNTHGWNPTKEFDEESSIFADRSELAAAIVTRMIWRGRHPLKGVDYPDLEPNIEVRTFCVNDRKKLLVIKTDNRKDFYYLSTFYDRDIPDVIHFQGYIHGKVGMVPRYERNDARDKKRRESGKAHYYGIPPEEQDPLFGLPGADFDPRFRAVQNDTWDLFK